MTCIALEISLTVILIDKVKAYLLFKLYQVWSRYRISLRYDWYNIHP